MDILGIIAAKNRYIETEPDYGSLKFCMNISTALRFALSANDSRLHAEESDSFQKGIKRILEDVAYRSENYWKLRISEQFLCEIDGMSVFVQIPAPPLRDGSIIMQPDYFISAARRG